MKILIYDIETMRECFLVVCYIPGEPYRTFEVSAYRNQLNSFIEFTREYSDYYWVGYNNLRFDAQVVQWVINNREDFETPSNLDVCKMIHRKAQDVIDDANYDVFPQYREEELFLKQIDLFRVHHFDNKNRRVSLKRLEFEMDLENIEEMPIHHSKTNLSEEDVLVTTEYCKNDVYATYQFWLITIGETSHPLYKGDNKIELRQNIEAEFGIPCLNYSDSKIGDEMIKKYYCKEKGIEYKSLPKKGMFRKEINVSHCIAPYVKFTSPELIKFLSSIKKEKLTMQDEFLKEIEFKGLVYTFAKGGLHSVNTPKIYEADDEYEIIDWDVSSYYPAIIINNRRYPYHLGKEFLIGYETMFDKRLELKPLAKKDKKIKGIVGALKLAVNSVYGKSSDMQSWIYDRQLTMFTTITGELSLMMLIEQYELAGITVISANTDGVTLRIKKDLLGKMDEINSWWCKITKYELERTDYKKIVFSTVNDYIAIKTDGEIKKKGDFLTDFELHKNKSARIVPLALEQYFVNNIPVEHTITSHNSIFDFCLRQKASKDFHYEGIDRTTGDKKVYNKLIRYYLSKKGEKLLKVKNEDSDSKAANVSQVEAGEWSATVCNQLIPSEHPMYGINYDYYIERCNRIISKIQTGGKKRAVAINPNQLSLF